MATSNNSILNTGVGATKGMGVDNNPLERAELLLTDARKKMRDMRAEIDRLRQVEEAYKYFKQVMDMHAALQGRSVVMETDRTPAIESQIEEFIKSTQEAKLNRLLDADSFTTKNHTTKP